MKTKLQNTYSIQVLQRTLKILDGFLESQESQSLDQISEYASLPKSTTFRIIANLLHANYLVEKNGRYWLGLKMLRLGSAVEHSLDIKQFALPHLMELRNLFNETVHLAVLENADQIVYLEKLSSQQAVAVMASRIGKTAPVFCTGVGKALAAFLPLQEQYQLINSAVLYAFTKNTITNKEDLIAELNNIRQCGFAIDDEEHENGVRCVAAPIFNHLEVVIAAISISLPAERLPLPLDGNPIPTEVIRIANQISEELGCPSKIPQ